MSLGFLAGALVMASVGANSAEIAVCASAAVLSGDPVPAGAVGLALRRHGVQVAPPVGCSPLRVAIARCDEGLRLGLDGPRGERAERVVASAETAALLIESWLRTDIAAPLLAAHALDDRAPAPASPPAAAAPPLLEQGAPAIVQAAALATAPDDGRLTLAVGAEAAFVRDGSRAGGAAIAACARVRSFCVGLGGRLLRVWPVSPDAEVSRALERTSGYGADVLASVELYGRLGRAIVRPGLGVGLGWIGTRGTIVDHSADFNALGPRAEARVALDLPVGRAFAVELSLAGGLGATATMDRVAMTRDRPLFVSGVAPAVHAGLGVRYGGGAGRP